MVNRRVLPIFYKRVFRYLKGNINLALTYRATGNDELHGYSDADWALAFHSGVRIFVSQSRNTGSSLASTFG